MTKNELENSKAESKIVMCKNCHQDILEEKMFLHEGFCVRNNVFCDICEKVFLKQYYDEHFKNLHNNLNKSKKDSFSYEQKSHETRSESGKKNSKIEHNDSVNNKNENSETIYPTPSFEFVQMPPTELFHINNPIIIFMDFSSIRNPF